MLPQAKGGLCACTTYSMHMNEPLILCDNLVKIYKLNDIEVVALQGLDLKVERGEVMALIGTSGSGKTTLLNVLGGLDRPSAGRVLVAGNDLLKLSDIALNGYRRRYVGFVWQQKARNLIPYLNATQNVELPMIMRGVGKRERRDDLYDLARSKPHLRPDRGDCLARPADCAARRPRGRHSRWQNQQRDDPQEPRIENPEPGGGG